MCKVHPGTLQERQQRLLQAQEQPPTGGARALNGIVRLLAAVPCAVFRGVKQNTEAHPRSNLSSGDHHPSAHHERRNESAVI